MKATLKLLAAAALGLACWPAATAADPPPAKAVIAFLGAAHTHVWGYCMAINGNKSVRAKYVWDHDARRAEECRHWLNDKPKVAASAEEVLADPEVNGVMICAETDRHHDLVLAAAKAGKAMFVEKPLAIAAKDAHEMAAAIEKAGVFFTPGYFMRCDRKYLFLKQQIAKGNFGQLTRVLSQTCHAAAFNHTFDNPNHRWFADVKQSGGGGFLDLGTHSLDLIMGLAGDVESATGVTAVVAHNYGDTDDCGEAFLRFTSGASGVIAAAWVCPFNPIQLEVVGTKGHAVIFNNQLYFQSQSVPGSDIGKPVPESQLPPGVPGPLGLLFRAAAGEKNLKPITAQEAAARVSVMEAIYAGAKTHAWVKPQ
jgi:predicted dehydrogenase